MLNLGRAGLPWKQRSQPPRGNPRQPGMAGRPGFGSCPAPAQGRLRVPHPQQPSRHKGAGTLAAPDGTPATPLPSLPPLSFPLPASPGASPSQQVQGPAQAPHWARSALGSELRLGAQASREEAGGSPGLGHPPGPVQNQGPERTWAGLAEQVRQEEQADGSGASDCLSGSALMTQVEAM